MKPYQPCGSYLVVWQGEVADYTPVPLPLEEEV
jgi:hypothetical protein